MYVLVGNDYDPHLIFFCITNITINFHHMVSRFSRKNGIVGLLVLNSIKRSLGKLAMYLTNKILGVISWSLTWVAKVSYNLCLASCLFLGSCIKCFTRVDMLSHTRMALSETSTFSNHLVGQNIFGKDSDSSKGDDWYLDRNWLTLSWRRLLSYRNQSIDLQSKSTFSFYMIKSSVIKELSYLECITSFLQNLTGTSICSSSTTLLSDLSNMTLKNDGF